MIMNGAVLLLLKILIWGSFLPVIVISCITYCCPPPPFGNWNLFFNHHLVSLRSWHFINHSILEKRCEMSRNLPTSVLHTYASIVSKFLPGHRSTIYPAVKHINVSRETAHKPIKVHTDIRAHWNHYALLSVDFSMSPLMFLCCNSKPQRSLPMSKYFYFVELSKLFNFFKAQLGLILGCFLVNYSTIDDHPSPFLHDPQPLNGT